MLVFWYSPDRVNRIVYAYNDALLIYQPSLNYI